MEDRYREEMEIKFKKQADQMEKQIQETQEKLMAAQEQVQAAQEQAQKERTLLAESMKIMMTSLNMTVEEVMSKMGIPPEKQTIYRNLIKNG